MINTFYEKVNIKHSDEAHKIDFLGREKYTIDKCFTPLWDQMLNTLTKTMLDQADVIALKPDLSKLKILKKEVAQAIETLIFDGEEKKLSVLTTNNKSEQLKKVTENLQQKGFVVTIYYTDIGAFTKAMDWYTLLEKQEQSQQEAQRAQESAAGKDALAMIRKLYDERKSMDDDVFLIELIRLSFQSGASDVHRQPEEK